MAVPGPVTGLTLAQVRDASGRPGVRLRFDNQTGVSYDVTRTTSGATPTTVTFSIPQPDDHHGPVAVVEYVDYAGITTTTYNYAVVARNADGVGAAATPEQTSITIPIPPAMTALTGVMVTRADGKKGVEFAFDYQDGVTAYRFIRQDTSGPVTYNLPQPALPPSNRRLLYQDFFVVSPGTYTYTVLTVNGTLLGPSTEVTTALTGADGGTPGTGSESYTGGLTNPGVVRWTFRDVWGTGGAQPVYTFEVNPNEGGSPSITKNMSIATNVGPNRGAVLQEGQNTAPLLNFSGVIITQSHYEALESWFDKKILIELKDDLGRTFRGVFSSFEPTRARRPYNPWYHTYSAQFTVFGYKNASGQIRYGRF